MDQTAPLTDKQIEEAIQDKKLVAPRVTLDAILAGIDTEEYFVLPGTPVTICLLTLKNGYTVTGQSACVSEENFNEELGREIARGKAINECWPLFGFQLASELSGWSMGS